MAIEADEMFEVLGEFAAAVAPIVAAVVSAIFEPSIVWDDE